MGIPGFVISKKAQADLEAIWTYTAANWSSNQADHYYQLIIDEINFICAHTDAGKSMEHIRKGYRASKAKSHLIFYKMADNVVQVTRILHERMDIPNRL